MNEGVNYNFSMDAHLIYIANEKMRVNIRYPHTEDSGWLYFGAQPEVNNEIVLQNINSHFSDTDLYVAHNRKDSFKTTKGNIINDIKNILGAEDFSIWDTSFSHVIDFNKIGVLRCGKKFDS